MVDFTTRLRLEKQDTNSNQNTWGTVLNGRVFDMVDEALGGVETIALAGSNVTLTTANGTTDQARNLGLRFTGTGGVTVTAPSVEKVYFVINDSNGAVSMSAGGTAVSIPAGGHNICATDGTDFYILGPSLDKLPAPTSSLDVNSQKITSLAAGTANTDAVNKVQMDNAIAAASTSSSPGTVKVTSSDTTAKFLNSAIVAGIGITTTINNSGANETLTIDGVNLQVDTYLTSGTWTKPSGASWVMVELWGAGAGGGSGRAGAAASVRGGGAAGGGGGYAFKLFAAGDLSSTVAVSIGAGGDGGAAISANDTSGNVGTAGGNTTFASYLTAGGGSAGEGGTTAANTGGNGGGAGGVTLTANTVSETGLSQGGGASGTDGGNGGMGGSAGGGNGGNGAGSGTGGKTFYSGAGGGGGGSIRSSNAAGGAGNGGYILMGGSAAAAGATAGAAGTAGGTFGGGGGGYAGDPSGGNAGAGGAGGTAGGGGGGGGCLNGSSSGAGGAGGDGYARIISW